MHEKTDDEELQEWLDAQEPVIDKAHAKAVAKAQFKAARWTPAQMRADMRWSLDIKAYEKAIGFQ